MNDGLLGRTGRWCATHFRAVLIGWGVAVLILGALAPRAEDELAGAGWKDSGSDSVAARTQIEGAFPGHGAYSPQIVLGTADGPRLDDSVTEDVVRLLTEDPAISTVTGPEGSPRITSGGSILLLGAGAAGSESEMVRAAERIRERIAEADLGTTTVKVTGLPGYWADFNDYAKDSMISAEIKSWPVTLLILAIAFGSLAAAGLPLLLTIIGLATAIGALYIGAQFGDISIWAVNFALMFALAVGIDYALFIVVRFRSALTLGLDPVEAVVQTMDTAGKAVLLSGLTVVAALLALLLIPSPPFQTTAIGMALAVLFVMAASLTLLPAVLARLGERVNAGKLPLKTAIAHRSERFGRWAEYVWEHPARTAAAALAVLLALMVPLLSMHTEMPGLSGLDESSEARAGFERVEEAFGPGSSQTLEVVAPQSSAALVDRALASDKSLGRIGQTLRADGLALARAIPDDSADRSILAGLRDELPADALVGGAVAERMDLETMLEDRLPLLYATIIGVGFLILLVALRAPLIAAAAVLLNLLATGAAFGIGVLVFQEGLGAGLLGIEAQGHITAWGPIFFFTLIFALAMDYTVFLLASVKEHYERSGDARAATIEGMARSGRVINAAAIVMVCVFFTFALAPALQPKEMGAILGFAVLLDASLIRLLLLPAVLRALGEGAWYLPSWLDRMLPRLRFSHD